MNKLFILFCCFLLLHCGKEEKTEEPMRLCSLDTLIIECIEECSEEYKKKVAKQMNCYLDFDEMVNDMKKNK